MLKKGTKITASEQYVRLQSCSEDDIMCLVRIIYISSDIYIPSQYADAEAVFVL